MDVLRPEDIKIEYLSEQHKEYAENMGLNTLIYLSKKMGGTSIYIPKYDELIRAAKYKVFMNEYKKGVQIKKLVKKYGISESTAYNLIKGNIPDYVKEIIKS